MKNNHLVKSAKFNILVLLFMGMISSVASAQVQYGDTTRTFRDTTFRNSDIDTINNINRQINKSDSLPLPKETGQVEGENIQGDPPGQATYNIDDGTQQNFDGAADWRIEETTEELKVYSGRHEGNNIIGTIEVEIPKKE